MDAQFQLPQQLDVTVAVKPRARFSCTQLALESLLANTTHSFKLLYLDGNSPNHIKNWLQTKLFGRSDTTLLRYDYYFGPFQAYNILLKHVDTKYVAIVDNDVYVQPGWLEKLYQCAEEEQAAVVMPLVTMGEPEGRIIHVAGGASKVITAPNGQKVLYRKQNLEDFSIDDVADQLRREPTELLELHCLLFRTDFIKSLLELDETVSQMSETQVLSKLCQQTGAKMWFEPTAQVAFLWGNKVGLTWSDLPFWNLMWSEKWARKQLQWLRQEYDVDKLNATDKQSLWWMGHHRRVFLLPLFQANQSLFKRLHLEKAGHFIEKAISVVEVGFNYAFVTCLERQKSARLLRLTPGATNKS